MLEQFEDLSRGEQLNLRGSRWAEIRRAIAFYVSNAGSISHLPSALVPAVSP